MHSVGAEGGPGGCGVTLCHLIERAGLDGRIIPLCIHVLQVPNAFPVARVRELHTEHHHEADHDCSDLVRVRVLQEAGKNVDVLLAILAGFVIASLKLELYQQSNQY